MVSLKTGELLVSRRGLSPLKALSRFWSLMLTTSEAAVAIHYRQPWADVPTASDLNKASGSRQSVMSGTDRSRMSAEAIARDCAPLPAE